MLKNKLLEALGQGEHQLKAIEVEGVDTKLFLRPLTALLREQIERHCMNHKSTWRSATLAHSIVDENGAPIFDLNNADDMSAIDSLPYAKVDVLYHELLEFNMQLAEAKKKN